MSHDSTPPITAELLLEQAGTNDKRGDRLRTLSEVAIFAAGALATVAVSLSIENGPKSALPQDLGVIAGVASGVASSRSAKAAHGQAGELRELATLTQKQSSPSSINMPPAANQITVRPPEHS